MLSLINPNAVQGAGPVADESVAASTLEMADTQPGAVFELPLSADELPSDLALLLSTNTTPASELMEAAQPDPERWLSSMLEQQAVSLQARELQPETAQVPVAGLPASVEQEHPQALNPAATLAALVLAERPGAQAQAEAASTASATSLPSAQIPAAAVMPASTAAAAVATGLIAQEQAQSESLSSLTSTAVDAPEAATLAEFSGNRAAPLTHTLKLQTPQAQWGEQMLQSLRDSVEMQINQRVQNATIRLDPPELGSLEIFLSHEGGRITVQLSAANTDVARLLQQTSERLRQELVAQNFVQVNVQVSADAQGGRQQGRGAFQPMAAEEPVLAAQDSSEQAPQQDSASDVLVTV
ncbi:flagellar hook-length control protein FliK [Pseudomonas sp. TTU2014-080ASC]|uniref:flagellar hook-length control protein FliK n=1 Tax=Pseudomonas sp. TTU2014-080ASC TaxID=1729724 RepID=UPI0007186111|nr:flagellar hook-length control protein FliK [Pseudomonas sp. TTU2014-080ASC]KRW60909.1 hypothetical protein AO726_06080 [Pseudomonas sp. TTU2014-080ASC]